MMAHATMGALAVSIHVVLSHLVLYMREQKELQSQTCAICMSPLNVGKRRSERPGIESWIRKLTGLLVKVNERSHIVERRL